MNPQATQPMVKPAGLVVAWPIAVFLLAIYVVQIAGTAYLLRDRAEKERTIQQQEYEIQALKDRLRILEAIEEYHTDFTPKQKQKLSVLIDRESRRYGFDPLLVLAIIQVESSFRPQSVSHMGARGLMQIKPSIGRAIAARQGVEFADENDLFDLDYNVRLGTFYLFELMLEFGDIHKAIIAYNHGETSIRGRLRHGHPLPTGYLRRVLSEYRRLQQEHDPERTPMFIGPPSAGI